MHIPEDIQKNIHDDCIEAMVDLLGDDFTTSYYNSCASDFVMLVEHYYTAGFKAGRGE